MSAGGRTYLGAAGDCDSNTGGGSDSDSKAGGLTVMLVMVVVTEGW